MIELNKIKHFIIIRFFTQQDPHYPYDIFDVDFLSGQLILANNALKSLENQTSKNFEIVFLAHEKFFADKKYEFIFSTLENATTLPIKFVKISQLGKSTTISWLQRNSGMQDLINEAYDNYDFVIQSCMDFDDFIYKDAIADTQSKVAERENILVYGYCKGYMYFDGELYPIRWRFEGNGHIAIVQSLIVKSSFARKIPFIGIYSFPHSKFKIGMKEFLEKNGIEFSESMFKQSTHKNALIYFRHEFSHNNLVTNKGKIERTLPNKKKLSNEVTKKQLAEEFAFFHELKSIK